MNKPARISIVVVVVILLILGGWWYGWGVYANNKKLSDLEAMAKEMMSQPRPTGPPKDGDRGREGFREMREQVNELPEAYQQQFRQSMGNMYLAREEQRMDEYLKLRKPERKKHLDKLIVEDEKRRKEWAARAKQREAERSQQAANGGGEQRGGNNSPAGGSPPNNGERRGGWGGRGSMSARLDSTSPEFRAKRTEFRRDMEQRRKELGLPVEQGWPGR